MKIINFNDLFYGDVFYNEIGDIFCKISNNCAKNYTLQKIVVFDNTIKICIEFTAKQPNQSQQPQKQ